MGESWQPADCVVLCLVWSEASNRVRTNSSEYDIELHEGLLGSIRLTNPILKTFSGRCNIAK